MVCQKNLLYGQRVYQANTISKKPLDTIDRYWKLHGKPPHLTNIAQKSITESYVTHTLPSSIPATYKSFPSGMRIVKLLVTFIQWHTLINHLLVSLNLLPRVLGSLTLVLPIIYLPVSFLFPYYY